jgi:hypothetical protein
MGLSRSKDLESQIRVITSKDRQCILLSHAANRRFPVVSELARVSEAGTASAGCVGELIAVTFVLEGGNLERRRIGASQSISLNALFFSH